MKKTYIIPQSEILKISDIDILTASLTEISEPGAGDFGDQIIYGDSKWF